jgi:hypothetical protein
MPPSLQLQQYLQSNEEEPYYILKTNNPVFLGFQTDTIPIISCHGYIRLPVLLQDLQAVENRCLFDGSFTTSNT